MSYAKSRSMKKNKTSKDYECGLGRSHYEFKDGNHYFYSQSAFSEEELDFYVPDAGFKMLFNKHPQKDIEAIMVGVIDWCGICDRKEIKDAFMELNSLEQINLVYLGGLYHQYALNAANSREEVERFANHILDCSCTENIRAWFGAFKGIFVDMGPALGLSPLMFNLPAVSESK